ncbi:hypothetical protein ACT3XG_14870 [Paenibacillus polymyxa]|uniref:hypothetical protein n=1 Tax=Paenibacillus TaxID=44249 RepID=UPI00142E80B8|nr:MULTISPECIES: hypothetical protein [Paenibacillus]KAF6658905.1 hypothetical protein HFD99_01445 [Paenibacillus sp. EKM301P]UBS85439.1 hypothetical protein LAZ93_14825 [Paenibacillus polymyxa]WHX33957.1 hypothetical protein QNH38_15305 [Paenibacillus polymyxa]
MSARIYVTEIDYDIVEMHSTTVQRVATMGTRIGAKVYTSTGGYLDVYVRVPGRVENAEEAIRNLLQEAVENG